MKNEFTEFEVLSEAERRAIWSTALIVFDANVLLNLYRYKPVTRNEYLTVLEKASDRLWIPHHVGLEFQRLRPSVIATQLSRLNQIRSAILDAKKAAKDSLATAVQKKDLTRHPPVDLEEFEKELDQLGTEFLSRVEEVKSNQLTVGGNDPIRPIVDRLYSGKVGRPPRSQEELDAIYGEAKRRMDASIPPGFSDNDKKEVFSFRGVNYQAKYGDYVLWHQLLQHAAQSKVRSIIFVTDDGKEDWWSQSSGQRIGPRYELVDDAKNVGKVNSFLMYSAARFLEEANSYLGTDVSDSSVEEVRVVGGQQYLFHLKGSLEYEAYEEALREYLLLHYDSVEVVGGQVDILAVKRGWRVGYEVIGPTRAASEKIIRVFDRITNLISSNTLDEGFVVFFVGSGFELSHLINRVKSIGRGRKVPVSVLFARIDEDRKMIAMDVFSCGDLA